MLMGGKFLPKDVELGTKSYIFSNFVDSGDTSPVDDDFSVF